MTILLLAVLAAVAGCDHRAGSRSEVVSILTTAVHEVRSRYPQGPVRLDPSPPGLEGVSPNVARRVASRLPFPAEVSADPTLTPGFSGVVVAMSRPRVDDGRATVGILGTYVVSDGAFEGKRLSVELVKERRWRLAAATVSGYTAGILPPSRGAWRRRADGTSAAAGPERPAANMDR